MADNRPENRIILKNLLLRNPKTKFVYFRRNGEEFAGEVIDVPVGHAILLINQYPEWNLLISEAEMEEELVALFKDEKLPELQEKDKLEVPPIPTLISDKEFNQVMFDPDSTSCTKMIDFNIIPPIKSRITELPIGKAAKLTVEKNQCSICGFKAKNASGLRLHGRKHKQRPFPITRVTSEITLSER